MRLILPSRIGLRRHAREVRGDRLHQAAGVTVTPVTGIVRREQQLFQREQPPPCDRDPGKGSRVVDRRVLVPHQPGDGGRDHPPLVRPEPDRQPATVLFQRTEGQVADPHPGVEGVVIRRDHRLCRAVRRGVDGERAGLDGKAVKARQGMVIDRLGHPGGGGCGDQQGKGEGTDHRLSR